MLTKTEIRLSFPAGACFHQAPSLYLYRRILQTIHHISCMQPDIKCCDCSLRSQCRYYWITGNNFEGYPGILCPADLFEKRKYEPGQELKVEFFWIGNCENFKLVAEIVLNEMNQTFLGNFFYLKKIKHSQIEENIEQAQRLYLKTPLSKVDLELSILDLTALMNHWYRKWYQTDFCFQISNTNSDNEQFCQEWETSPFIKMASLGMPTKNLIVQGHTGTITFGIPVYFSSVWKVIGLGKRNCIGGGKIATGHSI